MLRQLCASTGLSVSAVQVRLDAQAATVQSIVLTDHATMVDDSSHEPDQNCENDQHCDEVSRAMERVRPLAWRL
jgi:hypothetical protein